MPELIVHEIEDRLLTGQLKPGQSLPSEAELMALFGVGKYTVREGLRMLETSGFIKVKQGSRKGPIITSPSNSLVSDFLRKAFCVGGISRGHINQFRLALESSIIGILCSMTLDEKWASRIENNINETKEMHENGGDTINLNAQFHVLLAQTIGNPVFTILMNTIMTTPFIVGSVTPLKHVLSASTIKFHEKIFQAIKSGDSDQATILMKQHIVQIDEAWKAQDNSSIESLNEPEPSG